MIPDLELSPEQESLARSITRFCHDRRSASFEADWRGLADLGVLTLATPDGGGGAQEIAVAMSVLGGAGFPGPLVATVLAAHVVDATTAMATLAVGPVVPWAEQTDVVLEWDGDDLWRVDVAEGSESCVTIGGEPALRTSVERIERVATAPDRALAMAHLTVAAYLGGASSALLADAAAYARDRRQFGRPIGEFQAVAFPLADAYVRSTAAGRLAWGAAGAIDDGGRADGYGAAVMARLSARRAALTAVHTCHQVYGALSYTRESPMGVLRQRVAAYTLLPPAPAHLTANLGPHG